MLTMRRNNSVHFTGAPAVAFYNERGVREMARVDRLGAPGRCRLLGV